MRKPDRQHGAATSVTFAMLLGRRTLDVMAGYWPTATAEEGGDVFDNATKHVASRTPAARPGDSRELGRTAYGRARTGPC